MAPRSSYPQLTKTTTWSLQRAWESPTCVVTKKVIWPWHMAWRKRIDTGYDYKVFRSEDTWVSEDSYLILKLKGELDNV